MSDTKSCMFVSSATNLLKVDKAEAKKKKKALQLSPKQLKMPGTKNIVVQMPTLPEH